MPTNPGTKTLKPNKTVPQTHENEHVSILSLGLIVSPADPTPYSAFGDKFSNILYIVALYSKHSRALTFVNLC